MEQPDIVSGELHRSMKHAWELQELTLKKELEKANERNASLALKVRQRTEMIRELVKAIEAIVYFDENDSVWYSQFVGSVKLDDYILPALPKAKEFLETV